MRHAETHAAFVWMAPCGWEAENEAHLAQEGPAKPLSLSVGRWLIGGGQRGRLDGSSVVGSEGFSEQRRSSCCSIFLSRKHSIRGGPWLGFARMARWTAEESV